MNPIHGHALLNEGRRKQEWVGGEFVTTVGCECGARPEDWEHMTTRGIQRWHKLHKADLLGDPDTRPDRSVHLRSKTYIFCDVHAAPHTRTSDPYDDGVTLCEPSDWRAIWIAGSFEEQDRF